MTTPDQIVREWDNLSSLILGDAPDRLERPGDVASMRLAVARSLASHGIVLDPSLWSRTVRDLTDLWVARQLRDPFSPLNVRKAQA